MSQSIAPKAETALGDDFNMTLFQTAFWGARTLSELAEVAERLQQDETQEIVPIREDDEAVRLFDVVTGRLTGIFGGQEVIPQILASDFMGVAQYVEVVTDETRFVMNREMARRVLCASIAAVTYEWCREQNIPTNEWKIHARAAIRSVRKEFEVRYGTPSLFLEDEV